MSAVQTTLSEKAAADCKALNVGERIVYNDRPCPSCDDGPSSGALGGMLIFGLVLGICIGALCGGYCIKTASNEASFQRHNDQSGLQGQEPLPSDGLPGCISSDSDPVEIGMQRVDSRLTADDLRTLADARDLSGALPSLAAVDSLEEKALY